MSANVLGIRRMIAGAFAILAIGVGVVSYMRRDRTSVAQTLAIASPSSSTAAASDPAPPPPPPRKPWRASVRVPLDSGNPREAFWQMDYEEPLIEPDLEARPVTVLLHGMCADSSWTCEWLQYFEMAPQWQICPRAPSKCGGQAGYRWTSAADTLRVVELAIATARTLHGARMKDGPIVLGGMSQGAYAIAALAHLLANQASPSLRVKGIVLQGAEARISVADARRLGARIAFTAGDRDGAAPAMRAAAADLRRAGIDARWQSMGKEEGHFSSVSTGKTMAELVDWARGE